LYQTKLFATNGGNPTVDAVGQRTATAAYGVT
jgi:hypothetical protein